MGNLSSNSTSKVKALAVFTLVMITVGSVDSIRNLPATALFGSQLIFFFILGAVFFLIPSALVSAELSSTYPEQGGIYVWVKKALGEDWGFLAIWLQWIENVVWYPTILSFVAGTVGYVINPALANNKWFITTVIMVSFWGATVINILGMKASAWFSSLCTITGLILPMGLIIGLGAAWLIGGHPSQIHFNEGAFIPHLNQADTWVALTGVMLSYCGIEIATVHASDVRNPRRSFPVSLAYSTIIIVVTLILGSLAIAIIIPQKEISLVSGIMEAFAAFLKGYHAAWLLPLIAISLVLGGMGSVSNWIIAPPKGLLIAGNDGHLPKHFCKENQFGAPSYMLVYQAILVTALTTMYVVMPSINEYYWLLTSIGAELYMVMYVLMFVAIIVLRRREAKSGRAKLMASNTLQNSESYRIPGGLFGVYFVAWVGIIGSVGTIIVGFIPPDQQINIHNIYLYESLLIGGLLLMYVPPLLTTLRRRKSSVVLA